MVKMLYMWVDQDGIRFVDRSRTSEKQMGILHKIAAHTGAKFLPVQDCMAATDLLRLLKNHRDLPEKLQDEIHKELFFNE